jgi:hypothetical protein
MRSIFPTQCPGADPPVLRRNIHSLVRTSRHISRSVTWEPAGDAGNLISTGFVSGHLATNFPSTKVVSSQTYRVVSPRTARFFIWALPENPSRGAPASRYRKVNRRFGLPAPVRPTLPRSGAPHFPYWTPCASSGPGRIGGSGLESRRPAARSSDRNASAPHWRAQDSSWPKVNRNGWNAALIDGLLEKIFNP